MKRFSKILIPGFAALLFCTWLLHSQISATATPGNAASVTPESVKITDSSSQPLEFARTPSTLFVDENGQSVEASTVPAGRPVIVYHESEGDRQVARRVVVKKIGYPSESQPRIVAEGNGGAPVKGILTWVAKDKITVNPSGPQTDVSFTYSDSTLVQDENGKNLALSSLQSGQQVTVFYTTQGNDSFASRILLPSGDGHLGNSKPRRSQAR